MTPEEGGILIVANTITWISRIIYTIFLCWVVLPHIDLWIQTIWRH